MQDIAKAQCSGEMNTESVLTIKGTRILQTGSVPEMSTSVWIS